MPIPLIYNVRSVRQRWTSAIVAVLGIAGAVGVFVAMLSMARGFQATLVASGSPGNAIVLRAGAAAEMISIITLDTSRPSRTPRESRGARAARCVSAEVVVIAAFPLKKTGTDANVQIRGVSPRVLEVRDNVKIVKGRMFQTGLNELVAGRNVSGTYTGLDLGSTVKFGGGTWNVVGVFDAGGSAFDSELWCDARVLEPGLQAARRTSSSRSPSTSRRRSAFQGVQGRPDRPTRGSPSRPSASGPTTRRTPRR